jgi:prepilin-type N-terminal cleavage/methylation domain-containing protein
MKQHNKNQQGFTIIELLVATGVFTITIAIAAGVFVSGLRHQQAVSELISIYNNASLAMEQIMREVRTSFEVQLFSAVAGGPCDGSVRKIEMKNPTLFDNRVSYFLCQNSALNESAVVRSLLGPGPVTDPARITGRNVFVEEFNMRLINEPASPIDDNKPPFVTARICVRSAKLDTLPTVCMQSSVSVRDVET